MTGAGVTGYNHSKNFSIAEFSVNGAPGSNLNEQSGGGNETCCIEIPKHWRKGLKAKVVMEYDKDQGDPRPIPPPVTMTVDIPEYKTIGALQVHFYDGPRVLVVVSTCDIQHPFYPMSAQDKLPWKDAFSKQEATEMSKREKNASSITC